MPLFRIRRLAYDVNVETYMRLHTFVALVAVVSLGLLTACNGGDESVATPAPTAVLASTPAPTATPMARVPDPVLVTSSGVPGGGGSAGTEEAVEYVVEAGDTISGISERFGVEADLIREANDLEDDNINIGQTLLIPRGGTLPPDDDDEDEGPTSPTSPSAPSGDGTTYTVVEGDTAFGIALEFDTTVEALAAANGMTEDEITDLQIGQVINLPSPE